ncbi:late embryogenesis abundant protein At1g64065-like [Herrania umbratica]|uniref:Late embryogenesis abundant protein At1g64065-like n=1 Tax=Herrania umbratica TaxID=108875 RepID=A0A6J1B1W4_9ROSI|nr:late embryogenesis abundant protein At1g64065-like [Herrania umbratica]
MTSEDRTTSRRKRNIKCLAYVVTGVIAQTIIILLFVMLVMRIRNPKVRLGGVTVENLNSSSSSPSFSMNLNAQVTVKNTNFGHFKFQNSALTISYKGTSVGEATIVKARARARSTKKLNVTVSVSSNMMSRNSALSSDNGSETINLSSHAKLDGKIHLFKVFKKKKSAEMNCTMEVNTSSKQIQNLMCK